MSVDENKVEIKKSFKKRQYLPMHAKGNSYIPTTAGRILLKLVKFDW